MPFTDAELAYAAGLIDGEGTISLRRRSVGRGGNAKGSTYESSVYMSSTTPVLTDWMQQRWPGHIYFTDRRPTTNQKDIWKWTLERKVEVDAFLAAIEPFLVLKAPQARLILAYRTTFSGFRGAWAPVTDEVVVARAAIYDQMCSLNQRGRKRSHA